MTVSRDTRLASAFASNRLLATFNDEVRALIEPLATLVELARGDSVFSAGEAVTHSLFPYDSLMISMIVELDGGRTVEVCSIGKEGAVGGIVSCGHAPAYAHAQVQIAGPAAPSRSMRWRSSRQARPSSRTCSAATPTICSRR